MSSGEVVIQSMWSAGGNGGAASKGIDCTFQPLKEGYRAWAAGFGLPATLSGQASWMAAMNSSTGFSTAGPAPTSIARAITVPCWKPPKPRWKPYEWAYWMEGKPATQGHQEPQGRCAGQDRIATRDGGSYETRMGGIACWNARDGREQLTWFRSGMSLWQPRNRHTPVDAHCV